VSRFVIPEFGIKKMLFPLVNTVCALAHIVMPLAYNWLSPIGQKQSVVAGLQFAGMRTFRTT